jgi:hypothetical protein
MDGSRCALVVANDQYDDPGLRRLIAPAQDAAALAEVLADPSVGGFEVRVLHNESAQEIRFAVEDFFADRCQDFLGRHVDFQPFCESSKEVGLLDVFLAPQWRERRDLRRWLRSVGHHSPPPLLCV